ncbi:MAG: glycosyltransferase [Melioribacteraceae bacterium]|nr:glycosyltransferase [Melioribacteraceae bacterium]
MRIFWLFRSNLRHLEYYHKYDNLEDFEKNCHDFYMLFPIWLLRNDHFDSVVIWRLSNNPPKDINFNVDGKLYSQRWVKNFSEVFNYPKPTLSFFRGGFKEYDNVTKQKPKFFGLKLYLATGRRVKPQWGGVYDYFLQEDKRDMLFNSSKCLPFYKTASDRIFFPYLTLDPKQNEKYDLCWPCNFKQIRYKGQEWFIQKIAENKDLRKMKIVHCGNQPHVGKKMCEKYGVENIEFVGEVDRQRLNVYLNHSKFGLCLSNMQDGCPRVITEVLKAGTPLILRNLTRALPYYRRLGIVSVNDKNVNGMIRAAVRDYKKYKSQAINLSKNELSMDKIMEQNMNEWNKYLTKK